MMKRIALSMLCIIAALAASAFHVQMGFSGKSNLLEQLIKNSQINSPRIQSPFWGWTAEVGKTPEYLRDPQIDILGRIYITQAGETFPLFDGVSVSWNNPDRPEMVTLSVYGGISGVTADITIAETVNVGMLGYSGDTSIRMEYGVFTCRGNPYSVVMNDTSTNRTINGVEIPAGDSALLLFPLYLKTAEIPNVKFYDLDSGVKLLSGTYYHNGCYTLRYTGNIRIRDNTSTSTFTPPNAPDETLVFGDMKTANEDKVLYAENDMPIRSAIVNMTTNIQLMTWWDFDHGAWGSPKAMINGEVVCDGHSTDHIIAYTVNANSLKVNGISGKGYVYFTMSQTPGSGYSGGSCTMRCWDASLGSSTSAYANAPADHKAEVSAGTGEARFKMTINFYTGTWKVEPN